MTTRIFPRNLTARAASQIVGNPVTTRLESGVGNCFPGLEFDHRNLDRRFFPGLVFNFGVIPPVLADVDSSDSALAATAPDGVAALSSAVIDAMSDLRVGVWNLTSIMQGGRTIDLANAPNINDPGQLWRLVRDLVPASVTIMLTQTPPAATASPSPSTAAAAATATAPAAASSSATTPAPVTKTLTHYRRLYIDPDTGVIASAYRPGELTQSLCSPWMHDFRDCACDYWASNHPDIVLGGERFPLAADRGAANPTTATRPLDWLRADRGSHVAAAPSARVNDAFRLRHYQINSAWRSLDFVLEGREIADLYAPGADNSAEPFSTAKELADELERLCGLEQVVMLEYLYAYYSLRQAPGLDPVRASEITFVRHELLAVAVSEMRHLRWANQLLWTLAQTGRIKARPPVLVPSTMVPTASGQRPRALRALEKDVLKDFVAVERPSGSLDGAYSRVIATLAKGYPETMLQLGRQIVADGMEHFSRFGEITKVVGAWPVQDGAPAPWLRPIALATPAQAQDALDAYRELLAELERAYRGGDAEDAVHILAARSAMMRLDSNAEQLAAAGWGVPFF